MWAAGMSSGFRCWRAARPGPTGAGSAAARPGAVGGRAADGFRPPPGGPRGAGCSSRGRGRSGPRGSRGRGRRGSRSRARRPSLDQRRTGAHTGAFPAGRASVAGGRDGSRSRPGRGFSGSSRVGAGDVRPPVRPRIAGTAVQPWSPAALRLLSRRRSASCPGGPPPLVPAAPYARRRMQEPPIIAMSRSRPPGGQVAGRASSADRTARAGLSRGVRPLHGCRRSPEGCPPMAFAEPRGGKIAHPLSPGAWRRIEASCLRRLGQTLAPTRIPSAGSVRGARSQRRRHWHDETLLGGPAQVASRAVTSPADSPRRREGEVVTAARGPGRLRRSPATLSTVRPPAGWRWLRGRPGRSAARAPGRPSARRSSRGSRARRPPAR
ncbi:hypothetical protein SAMN05444336_101304 [Albimonas donghaensis]|uniref:Uncharacterized protein n=1 Tax=Albimonas donghaensis TaxID=356660 RepID=A0A1H2RBY8_9RHOB|nr:hypothetical protein SAMN05444336_101304 [Albimonas donghaensis]